MKQNKKRGKRQEGLLRLFWADWFRQDVDRLGLLCVYAEKVCKVVAPDHVQRSRRKFNRAKWRSLGLAGDGICQCCYQVGPRIWHHIIQIQHGGVEKASNLVKICEDCHATIHPWLKHEHEQLLPDDAYRPFWSR